MLTRKRALSLSLLLLAACSEREVTVGDWVISRRGQGGAGGVAGAGASLPAGSGGQAGTSGSLADGGPMLPGREACAPATEVPSTPVTLPRDELARRLAQLYWRSAPDDLLRMKAQNITDTAGLALLAREMIEDRRGQAGIHAFGDRWLKTSAPRDTRSNLALTALQLSSLVEEGQRNFASILLGGGVFSTLLTSARSFVNETTAPIYGVTLPVGSGWVEVDLPRAERAGGFLTRANMLFAFPRGPHRGAFIREAFLCQQIPAPPPGDFTVRPRAGQTTRAAIEEQLAAQPECAGCHNLMTEGFTLERFDELGRHRLTDNGAPVVMKARVQLDDETVEVDDYVGLASRLAQSCEAVTCAARQALGFALDRTPAEADVVALARLFQAQRTELKALFTLVATTPAFLAP